MLEIELKASIPDRDALKEALLMQGFQRMGAKTEADTYFNGLDRDFAKTDEALRLRITTNADTGEAATALTYKGPKLDARSQTREEYEVGVQDGPLMHALLLALGYRPVLVVNKRREYYKREGVTACVDAVSGLGSYMELEMLSEQAEYAAEVELLYALLQSLGIPRSACTQKSYLEMLLEKQMRA